MAIFHIKSTSIERFDNFNKNYIFIKINSVMQNFSLLKIDITDADINPATMPAVSPLDSGNTTGGTGILDWALKMAAAILTSPR